jgi:hypothetical protein
MKKVHSTRQLFHLFCNMTSNDLEGFKTPSRNVFVESGVIYSYGYHYPMAKKFSHGFGSQHREVILVNAEKSSVTTQKHKSQIGSSIKPGQLLFEVPNILEPKAKENETHLMNSIVDSVDAVLKGLKYWSVETVIDRVDKFNRYALIFKLKPFKINAELMTILATRSIETEKKNETSSKKREAKQAAERAANRARYAEQVELWYSCKNTMNIPSGYFGLNYDPVRVNNAIVESPRGATVTLEQAEEFCRLLRNGLVGVGMRLEQFEVISIDSEIVEIGCHKINIKQAIKAVLGE